MDDFKQRPQWWRSLVKFTARGLCYTMYQRAAYSSRCWDVGNIDNVGGLVGNVFTS